MKIIFIGSEDFSLPSFEALRTEGHQIAAVVTQPDRKRGRGLKESPTPVAEIAESLGIPVYKPVKLKAPEFLEILLSLAPDLVVVCAYGRILNRHMLACPLKGCINVHPSLLPLYRGAMPIESALMAGDDRTGTTIFYMDEGCDTGDIIVQREYPIDPDDTRGTLRDKLAGFSAEVLKEALRLIDEGKAPRIRQPEDGVCATGCMGKDDTFISWACPPVNIRNFTRALWPRPAAQAFFRDRLIKIGPLRITESPEGKDAAPGTIVDVRKNEGPVIKAGGGFVLLTEIKPEGRKLMTATEFLHGYSPRKGEQFRSVSGLTVEGGV